MGRPRSHEDTKNSNGWLRAFVSSWLILGVGITAQTPSPNWPQFRGNPRLTGVAPTAPPDTLRLKWTFEAGDSIESSAAIVDGAVYVGSVKGELIAIDLETGKARWRYSTGEAGFTRTNGQTV